jgi:hypothetical protein
VTAPGRGSAPSSRSAWSERWGSGSADRAVAVAASVIVEQFLCHPGDVASLAPPSGHPQVDLPAHASRPSFNPDGHREVFTSLGARVIRIPVRAPRASAIAERWVGIVRRECTDRLLVYNEHHLRRVLAAYERHYNTYRPHRARDRRPPQPAPAAPTDLDHVRLKRRQTVDGLISEYRNAA